MKNHPSDVQSRGFEDCASADAARAWVDAAAAARSVHRDADEVSLAGAAQRVLARDVTSSIAVPQFDRAMMDGYAVRAIDIAESTDARPIALRVIGACLPGEPFDGTISTGETVRIMTGAPMPDSADTVAPVEITRMPNPSDVDGKNTPSTGRVESDATDRVLILEPVSAGKNFGRVGEDVAIGDALLSAGRVLRPQDIGVLSSIGVGRVSVVRRPRVALVITGNELLPAGEAPRGCKIADANGPMLAALAARDGAEIVANAIIADDRAAIRAALYADADVILVSGGSSCGVEDFAPSLLAEEGELAIHGIDIRPARPIGVGMLGERIVFLLPGNPVACLFAYDYFAARAIRALGGRPIDWPYRAQAFTLSRPIRSKVGRTDYVRVQFANDAGAANGEGGADQSIQQRAVEPVPRAGASVLSSTVRADGFVLVPPECKEIPAGKSVDVFMYDDFSVEPPPRYSIQ